MKTRVQKYQFSSSTFEIYIPARAFVSQYRIPSYFHPNCYPRYPNSKPDLKFSRSRTRRVSPRLGKKEEEREREKVRRSAHALKNRARSDISRFRKISSSTKPNLFLSFFLLSFFLDELSRKYHFTPARGSPPPSFSSLDVWPGNYISGTRDRMSTSRCNARVIANGTTFGPGGEGMGKNRHDDGDDASTS